MRKYWYLDAQFTNLLHLTDDVVAPVAEFWRRFIAFSSSAQVMIIETVVMIGVSAGIFFLVRHILRKEFLTSLRLVRALELYFLSQRYHQPL